MGRTSPPIRLALDLEAEKLRKSIGIIQDPLIREALLNILSSYNDIFPFLMSTSPQLPIDSILLAALTKLWVKVSELERKMAHKSDSNQGKSDSCMDR